MSKNWARTDAVFIVTAVLAIAGALGCARDNHAAAWAFCSTAYVAICALQIRKDVV